MKTLMNQLTSLRSQAEVMIANLISNAGVKSEFQDTHVLKLEDLDFLTNAPQTYGRYLVEVANNRLIDDNGANYSFCLLPVETLLEIADHFNQKIKDVIPKYTLGDGEISIIGSDVVEINEKIRDQELFEYTIVDREDMISNLIQWISECGQEKENDKFLMQQDLELLNGIDDDFVFSSINTNEYIYEGCSDFNKTCKELLELNKSHSE